MSRLRAESCSERLALGLACKGRHASIAVIRVTAKGSSLVNMSPEYHADGSAAQVTRVLEGQALKLNELIGAYELQENANPNGKPPPCRIADKRRHKRLKVSAANLKLASTGCEDIFHPLALTRMGECDKEALRR